MQCITYVAVIKVVKIIDLCYIGNVEHAKLNFCRPLSIIWIRLLKESEVPMHFCFIIRKLSGKIDALFIDI